MECVDISVADSESNMLGGLVYFYVIRRDL